MRCSVRGACEAKARKTTRRAMCPEVSLNVNSKNIFVCNRVHRECLKMPFRGEGSGQTSSCAVPPPGCVPRQVFGRRLCSSHALPPTRCWSMQPSMPAGGLWGMSNRPPRGKSLRSGVPNMAFQQNVSSICLALTCAAFTTCRRHGRIQRHVRTQRRTARRQVELDRHALANWWLFT